MTDVDLGSANLWLIPGGWSQTGNGPSSSDAVFDTITAGDITMHRMHPGTFTDISAGDVSLTGSSIVTETISMANFDIGAFTVAGCGWNMIMDAPTMESFKSVCSSSSAENVVSINDADLDHGSSSDHVIDGRNSHITVGQSSITSTGVSAGTTEVAKARSGTNVVLVDVDLNGNDCSDSNGDTGNCAYDVSSSSSNPSLSASGGLGNVSVYREAAGARVYKADHVVTSTLLDSSMNEMFQLPATSPTPPATPTFGLLWKTATVPSYSDHVIRAFGTAGQNETCPSNYWRNLASSPVPKRRRHRRHPPGPGSWSRHRSCSTTQPSTATSSSTTPSTPDKPMTSGGYDLRRKLPIQQHQHLHL